MPTSRIRNHSFSFVRQYLPGHVLTEEEAEALTGLLAENVRNNVDQWVVEKLGESGMLDQPTHSALQDRIATYAEGYKFKVKNKKTSLTPLDVLVQALAEEQVRAERGLGPGEPVSPVDIASAISRTPALRAEAERRLAIQQRVAGEALAGLL